MFPMQVRAEILPRAKNGSGCRPRTQDSTASAGEKRAQGRKQTKQASIQSLKTSIKRFLRQFRVIRRALVHPQVPWHAKAVAGCAVLYVVSPIQLIPNFIPIMGQMDDVVVVILAMRFLKRNVSKSVLDDCENDLFPPSVPTAPVRPATGPLPNSTSLETRKACQADAPCP
jgi:uncharacterized membrane protein YkvA (DUF1232 family)